MSKVRLPKDALIVLTAALRLPRAEFVTEEIGGGFSSVAKVRLSKLDARSPVYLTSLSAKASNKREAEQCAARQFLAKYSAMSRTWWSDQKAKARAQAPCRRVSRQQAAPRPQHVRRDRGESWGGGRPAAQWGT